MKKYFSVVFLLAVEGLFASEDPAAIRSALTARLERLQNVSVDYKLTETIKLSPEAEKEKLQQKGRYTIIHECGTLKFTNTFSFLGGRKLYKSAIQFISEDGQYHLPLGSSETTSYLENHVEYLVQGNNPAPTGSIKGQLTLPSHSGIEVGLGMKTDIADHWITSEIIHQADLRFDEADNPVLTWIDERGRSHEWTISPDLGYAATSYRILHPKNKDVLVEIVMSDFKPVSGLMVPYRMVTKSRNPQTGDISIERQFEVIECRINDPRNTPARYRIAWPKGICIIDERSGIIYISEKDGQVMVDGKPFDRMIRKTRPSKCAESKPVATRPSGENAPTTQALSTQ